MARTGAGVTTYASRYAETRLSDSTGRLFVLVYLFSFFIGANFTTC